MKIYYAHPMSWYDTDREAADVKVIRDGGDEPVNPNSSDFTAAVSEAKALDKSSNLVMAIFFDSIADVEGLAYRTFDDGYLGAGVASEILQAYIKGKMIFQILDTYKKGPMLFEQSGLKAAFGPRVLTIDETRNRIKRRVM